MCMAILRSRTVTIAPLMLAVLAISSAAFAADSTGSFDRSLSVSGPVDLEAVTDAGGITIRTGAPGTVHVHATLRANWGMFGSGDVEDRIRELERHPPIQQNGNQIRIGTASEHNLLRNISMRLEIETPPDTKVRVNADSGGIRVEGVHGRVDCKTDSGGIQLSNIGSDVRAEADSGGIHIEDVKGSAWGRVDSGGITALGIAGPVTAEADSGHISIRQSVAAPIRAKADSGGITVELAKGAGYDIDAQTESGGISAPALTVNSEYSKHHVQGKLHGGGPLVDVRVDSGGIEIH